MKRKYPVVLIALLLISFLLHDAVLAEDLEWKGLSRTFILNSNIYPHYTGPAAVESVLAYLSGIDYEQKDLAAACKTTEGGTYLQAMADCINARQSGSRLAVYNGQDRETVAYSLYDTVARRDIPAIIGVRTDGIKGWPFQREGSRYLLVYGISTDLNWVKIADPIALTEAGRKASLPRFYTIAMSSLYDAYVQANAGLLYAVNRSAQEGSSSDAPSLPAGLAASLSLRSSQFSLALSPHPKLTLLNSGNLTFSCETFYELQKYNSVLCAWEAQALPDHVGWDSLLITLKPSESYVVDDYLLEYTQAGPGIYRFAKPIRIDSKEVWVISPMFELVK